MTIRLSPGVLEDLDTYWRLTEADGARRTADGRWPLGELRTAGEMAKLLNPDTRATPALDVIDEALVDVDEGRCNRLIISVPPQEGKSERVSHYAPLHWLRRNPNLRIGIVSYVKEIAQQFSYAIRSDITTFDGTDGSIDLGLRLASSTRAIGRFGLAYPRRGTVIAIGIGGGLAGRPLDRLIIDDPVKDMQAADSEYRSYLAWVWYMSVARPRVGARPVIIVTTRWSALDLAGRAMAKQAEDEASGAEHYDRWRVINIPAQADHDPDKGESDVLGRQPGEYMISARGRSEAEWEATKQATAPRLWTALFQGRPSNVRGDVFLRHWWPRYTRRLWADQPDGSRRLIDFDEVIQSWDLSFKDTAGTDYVAGAVWARRGSEAFLIDQVHARLGFTDTIAAFRALTAKWPQAGAKLVEDKANGPAVIDMLKTEIPGIIAVQPQGSKYARAVAISTYVEAGNVWLPNGPVALFDVEGYVEELAGFPHAANDDQVDQTSQALARLLLHLGVARLSSAEIPEGRLPSTKPAGGARGATPGSLPPHLRRLAARSMVR